MPAVVPLESLETFAFGLDHPEGICITPGGSMYVGGEAGQIYRVDEKGAIEEITSTGGFILGLAADAEGRVYAIDNSAKCVWRVDPERGTIEVWASGPDERPFRTPNWGAFDEAGAYYLTDSGGWGADDGWCGACRREASQRCGAKRSANFPNGLCARARRLQALRPREPTGRARGGRHSPGRLRRRADAPLRPRPRPSPTASR